MGEGFMTMQEVYETIVEELTEIYQKKNHDYGNSFSILYQKFGLKSVIIRLWDKLLRLETLCDKEAKVSEETIDDTLKDLANYAIMALAERECQKYINQTER
jgi:glutathionyl-hydroquinone reductase